MIVRAPSSLNAHLQEVLRLFKLDRTYVRGEGSWLTDERGRRVLDLSSQYGAVPFGHNPKELWDAIESVRRDAVPALVQPSRPIHAEALAERLARLAPVGNGDAFVAFLQSGTEAVEAAIRLARLATGRTLVVGAERGYHGRTLGSASLSWKTRDETGATGFAHVAWNDVAALEELFARRGSEIAALVLEPVQGEGGVHEGSPAWFQRARELTTQHGALLVLDEVQTGLGRLGVLFGAELTGVKPDVLLLSKALGGGLVPLAAVIAAQDLVPEEFALGHGSTFANNNLTCRVGSAVLDLLEETDVLANAARQGERLKRGLEELARKYPGAIKEVRGRGLLLAIELAEVQEASSFLLRHLQQEDGWLPLLATWLLEREDVRVIPCLGAKALRIQPALNVTDEEVERALTAIESLVRVIHHEDWANLVGPVIEAPARPVRDERARQRPVIASRAIEVGEEPTRFAFLIHHTCPDDLVDTTPALASLSPEERHALYRWTAERPGHSPLCFMPSIRGANGAVAQGWLIGVTHVPETMRARPRAEVSREMNDAVATARQLGAHVVGLGAFTSIVTANGAEISFPGAVTTGSALTVAMTIDGIALAIERMALPLPLAGEGRGGGVRGVVVGLGVVGSSAAVLLAELVDELVLLGNPARPERERAKVEALADRIYARAASCLGDGRVRGVAAVLRRSLPRWRELGDRGRTLAVRLAALASGDAVDATGLAREIAWASLESGSTPPCRGGAIADVRSSDVVVTATSAATPLVNADDLRPGAIVCDVAKPADVSRAVQERADVLVFDGGLVRYPEPISFGPNMGYEPGVNLACLTETVVLALEGVREGRFGVGLASDLVDEVGRIRAAARRHGFSIGELRMGGRRVPDERFESAARAAAHHARRTRSC